MQSNCIETTSNSMQTNSTLRQKLLDEFLVTNKSLDKVHDKYVKSYCINRIGISKVYENNRKHIMHHNPPNMVKVDLVKRFKYDSISFHNTFQSTSRMTVTCISFDLQCALFAVGSSNGSIRIYDFDEYLAVSQSSSSAT